MADLTRNAVSTPAAPPREALAEAPRTLTQLLYERARSKPEHVSFRQKAFGIWQTYTWARLADRVTRFAAGLQALGVGAEDRVAILSENRIEWVVAELATSLLGAVPVAMYPGIPEGLVAAQLEKTGAKAVICEDQEQTDKVLNVRSKLPRLHHVIVIDPKGTRPYQLSLLKSFASVEADPDARGLTTFLSNALAAQHADHVGLICHSLGMEDRQRPVALTHRTIHDGTVALQGRLALGPDDASVSLLPLAHPAEHQLAIVLPLLSGVVTNFGESRRTALADMREIAPTVLLGFPRLWAGLRNLVSLRIGRAGPLRGWLYARAIRGADRTARGSSLWYWLVLRQVLAFLGLSRVRYGLSIGGPLAPSASEFFALLGVPLRNAYAVSDLGGFVSIANTAEQSSSVGPLLSGFEHRIASDGQLAVCRSSDSHWHATGDIARAQDALLTILGRARAAIVRGGGEIVHPEGIEAALEASPFVRGCIVTGARAAPLTALVQIDFDVAREWAEAQDIPYSTYRSLAEHPRIKALVGEIIARMNATLPEAQRIEQAFVLPEELDPGAGALTALATPRRHAVRNRFADRLLATHLERDKTRPGGTMRIAIIGAGNVGGSLGKGWVERGHAVSFGVRNPAADKSKALAIECGGKAAVVSVQAAAARADVIVLATPWEVTETALRECGDLSGKIVVDCTNPLATDLADGLTLGHSDSGAERVAHWARGARVVKAFNSTGWNNMIAPKIGEQTAVMFVCGDDPQAKADVLALAMDLGFEAIDAGELKVARMLEPYALLWIHLAYRQGLGREYAFTLARRRIN